MAKISSYINGNPSLSDKILGTSVSGPPTNSTENFTLQSVLNLFIPKLTTTQINAIVSPVEGSLVYNITLQVLCFRDSTTWRKVTYTTM